MKTLKSLAKLALAVVVLLSASGCYTMGIGKDYDVQGKVWRGDVTRQFHVTSNSVVVGADVIEKGHYDPVKDRYLRAVLARIFDGVYFKDLYIASYAVPDRVEFADLEKGAIVDFVVQRGTDVDYRVGKFNRIVRLVCAGSDKACIRRERSAGRVNTVIDANPASDFSNGNTYNRRVSAEERAKYD